MSYEGERGLLRRLFSSLFQFSPKFKVRLMSSAKQQAQQLVEWLGQLGYEPSLTEADVKM